MEKIYRNKILYLTDFFSNFKLLWIWMVEWRNIFQFERVLFDKKMQQVL